MAARKLAQIPPSSAADPTSARQCVAERRRTRQGGLERALRRFLDETERDHGGEEASADSPELGGRPYEREAMRRRTTQNEAGRPRASASAVLRRNRT